MLIKKCGLLISISCLSITAIFTDVSANRSSATEPDNPANDCPEQDFIPSGISEVAPTDCAAQVLQEMISRLDLLDLIPDANRLASHTLTRHEFAAILEATLDGINRRVAEERADNITRQDIDVLQEYQEEFAVELRAIQCESVRNLPPDAVSPGEYWRCRNSYRFR